MPRKNPKKYLIRQANTISFSRHNLNVVEKRIVYLLVSRIKPDDKDFQDYVFTFSELLEGLNLGDKNHKYLVDTCESMIQKTYQIPLGHKDDLVISPISSAHVNSNDFTITFRFDPGMKPYYLELKKNYTQFNLEIVLGLKSAYSQKLYEMAKSIENKGDPTANYSIAEWRYLLFIEEKEYKNYFDFKKKVFMTAQRELDEKTDIHLEYKEEKYGKKVNRLWMEVHKIENEEQRQAWIRQTKFNQLPKREREKRLGIKDGQKPTLSDVPARVEARQKATAELF